MHKNGTKCNKTLSKWCKNKHGASKIIDMFETYHLPPWLCMKQKFIMMPVLIQGPKQPGNNIDVYIKPLVDELVQLWAKPGVPVWDEHKQEDLTYERCCSLPSMIGLLLVTFQDRHTRDTRHARTVYKRLKVYI
jgi:hypothetical protein